MVKSKRVPEILIKWAEKTKTLDESEIMLETLLSDPDEYSAEIQYMRESISALSAEMDDDREEVERILQSIRFDFQAFMFARLHYFCAMPWDAVAEFASYGSTTEAVKARVYRAFENSNSEKAIRRIAQFSDEI